MIDSRSSVRAIVAVHYSKKKGYSIDQIKYKNVKKGKRTFNEPGSFHDGGYVAFGTRITSQLIPRQVATTLHDSNITLKLEQDFNYKLIRIVTGADKVVFEWSIHFLVDSVVVGVKNKMRIVVQVVDESTQR